MMPANWSYIVIGTCILLAAFLLWNEFRRASKANLIWRLAAVVLAVAMLAGIALPLKYNSEVKVSADNKTILLTKGFDADSLKDLEGAQILTMDAAVKKDYPKTTLIRGVQQIDTTRQLHVYGHGLSTYQLDQLGNMPAIFHPAKPADGVANISWNATLKAGEQLRVQGKYHNTSAQKVQLILRGLNTVLDTTTIKPNSTSEFELVTVPKATGRVVYTLQSIADEDTLTQGSIPLQVDPVKPLRVLMLAASPDFETKFLKNWMGEQGYAVASRSAISKDKFTSEYVNVARFPLDRLSIATLKKFDVVIGDLSILNNLSGKESAALKQEVTDGGLGVIVRADSSGKTSWLQTQSPTRQVGKDVPAYLSMNGNRSGQKLSVGAHTIIFKNGTQTLVTGPQNQELAGSALSGSGKVVFTTLADTYSWMLNGNRQDYSVLWSALVSSAARKDTALVTTIHTQSIPYLNSPAQLAVSPGSRGMALNDTAVAPVQNSAIPFEWSADYWPTETGWQSIAQGNKKTWWYAYKKRDWQGVNAAAKTAATARYASLHPVAGNVTKQIQQKVRIDVPKIYFYMLLLAACTFLWIENKLS